MAGAKPMAENIQTNTEQAVAAAPEAISSGHGLIITLMVVTADTVIQTLGAEMAVAAEGARVGQIQNQVPVVLTAGEPEAGEAVTVKMDTATLVKPVRE